MAANAALVASDGAQMHKCMHTQHSNSMGPNTGGTRNAHLQCRKASSLELRGFASSAALLTVTPLLLPSCMPPVAPCAGSVTSAVHAAPLAYTTASARAAGASALSLAHGSR